jgi:5'-3' exonuclease
MGIKGLWKELAPICSAGHVSQFKGQRVAVDGYCWLHRAAIASTIALCTGQPCEKFIHYFISRVDMLIRFGVIPVIVFDGCSMPMKAGTDASRRERREAAKAEGLELLRQGRREEAAAVLEKSIDISLEVAHAVIQILRRKKVECIVAPYEADAQLAYLYQKGLVQAIITEDSDLVAYGNAVILAKLDGQGNCDLLRSRDIPHLPSLSGVVSASPEGLLLACILSGCDYLPSLPGVGIKTAAKAVQAAKGSIHNLMEHFKSLGFGEKELAVYEEGLHKAYYCFRHHLVYDPVNNCIVPFKPLPEGVPLRSDILGEITPSDVARKMCREIVLNPHTRQPYTLEHEPSVKRYLKVVVGGQRTLHESGMQITILPNGTSHTTTQHQHQSSSNPSAAALLPRVVDSVSGWRMRAGQQQHLTAPVPASAPSVQVVIRSKYFREEEASPVGEGEAQVEEEVVVVSPAEVDKMEPLCYSDEQLDRDGTSPIDGQDGPLVTVAPEPQPPTSSSASSQQHPISQQHQHSQSLSQSLRTKELRDVVCPHGYKECGRVHSFLIKCFADHPEWKVPSGSSSQKSPLQDGEWTKDFGEQREHRKRPRVSDGLSDDEEETNISPVSTAVRTLPSASRLRSSQSEGHSKHQMLNRSPQPELLRAVIAATSPGPSSKVNGSHPSEEGVAEEEDDDDFPADDMFRVRQGLRGAIPRDSQVAAGEQTATASARSLELLRFAYSRGAPQGAQAEGRPGVGAGVGPRLGLRRPPAPSSGESLHSDGLQSATGEAATPVPVRELGPNQPHDALSARHGKSAGNGSLNPFAAFAAPKAHLSSTNGRGK